MPLLVERVEVTPREGLATAGTPLTDELHVVRLAVRLPVLLANRLARLEGLPARGANEVPRMVLFAQQADDTVGLIWRDGLRWKEGWEGGNMGRWEGGKVGSE